MNYNNRRILVIGFVLFALVVFLSGLVVFHRNSKTTTEASKGPATLQELLKLSPTQLEQCDLALMNLLCATGLKGSEGLDIQECLKTLEEWAEQVRWETQRHEYRYNEHKADLQNSYGRYRMMMLGGVLAQDVGLHYNPTLAQDLLDAKTPTFVWAADSKNLFVHGLLGGKHEGTCATMPLLFVAIGRRLGYPVALAGVKSHIYVRYEEPNGGHFNVETTMAEGFLTPPDEDYNTGIFFSTPQEIGDYGWLRPMSNAEILSQFLNNRAICLGTTRQYAEAKQMFLAAARYQPNTSPFKELTQRYLHALYLAPLGDKIDDLRNEVRRLKVLQGPRFVYLENRKGQVSYFLANNTNWSSMDQAVNDLKREIDLAAKGLLGGAKQPTLEFTSSSGKRHLLPAEALPPPLNSGIFPREYQNALDGVDLDDERRVWDVLWTHFKETTPDWMGQAAQLSLHPPIPGKL